MKTMKKLFFMAILAISVPAVQAQGYTSWKAPKDDPDLLKFSILAYGGYNILENAPLGGIAVGFNCYCIRAEADIGFSSLETPTLATKKHYLAYFSPAIGLAFGDKYEFYAMVGFMNWGYVLTTKVTECEGDIFSKSLLHCRLKVGSNIMVSKKLFINADLSYLIPKNAKLGYIYFDHLALRVGIGYRF